MSEVSEQMPITVKDAVPILGVSPNTVRKWADSTPPLLPSWRLPGNSRRQFHLSDVIALRDKIRSGAV